jgi:uncharacterized membrane protein YidH (DUF202 family)
MTPKSIFTIILKIFGLWFILGLMQVLPNSASIIPLIIQEDLLLLIISSIFIAISLGIYIFVIWLFLFKTGLIIDKLSLDKHFDQSSFEINIQQRTVIQISIIILGGLICIDALPMFINEVLNYLRMGQFEGTLTEFPNFNYIVINGLKLVFGYLLMTNSKRVTNWVDKQKEEEEK